MGLFSKSKWEEAADAGIFTVPQVHYLRAYNPEDLNELHEKLSEVSDQIRFEEYPPAREALVRLMEVYINAIERILTPVHHHTAIFDLGSEVEHIKEHHRKE